MNLRSPQGCPWITHCALWILSGLVRVNLGVPAPTGVTVASLEAKEITFLPREIIDFHKGYPVFPLVTLGYQWNIFHRKSPSFSIKFPPCSMNFTSCSMKSPQHTIAIAMVDSCNLMGHLRRMRSQGILKVDPRAMPTNDMKYVECDFEMIQMQNLLNIVNILLFKKVFQTLPILMLRIAPESDAGNHPVFHNTRKWSWNCKYFCGQF